MMAVGLPAIVVTGLPGACVRATLMSADHPPPPFTVCVNVGEVLVANEVRLKVAVIEWLATVRAVVVKVAIPLETVLVPMVVAPSRKVTVPVLAEAGVIFAVKVTGFPKVEGFDEEDIITLVGFSTVTMAFACAVAPLGSTTVSSTFV